MNVFLINAPVVMQLDTGGNVSEMSEKNGNEIPVISIKPPDVLKDYNP